MLKIFSQCEVAGHLLPELSLPLKMIKFIHNMYVQGHIIHWLWTEPHKNFLGTSENHLFIMRTKFQHNCSKPGSCFFPKVFDSGQPVGDSTITKKTCQLFTEALRSTYIWSFARQVEKGQKKKKEFQDLINKGWFVMGFLFCLFFPFLKMLLNLIRSNGGFKFQELIKKERDNFVCNGLFVLFFFYFFLAIVT